MSPLPPPGAPCRHSQDRRSERVAWTRVGWICEVMQRKTQQLPESHPSAAASASSAWRQSEHRLLCRSPSSSCPSISPPPTPVAAPLSRSDTVGEGPRRPLPPCVGDGPMNPLPAPPFKPSSSESSSEDSDDDCSPSDRARGSCSRLRAQELERCQSADPNHLFAR